MVKIKGGVKLKGRMFILTYVAGPVFWETARAPWTALEVTWDTWE